MRIYPLLGSTKYRIPDVLDFERGFDGVISLLTYDDGAEENGTRERIGADR